MTSLLLEGRGGVSSWGTPRSRSCKRASKNKCKLLNRIRNEPLILIIDSALINDGFSENAIKIITTSNLIGRPNYCFSEEKKIEQAHLKDLWAWLTPDWYEKQVESNLNLLTEAELLARHRWGLK